MRVDVQDLRQAEGSEVEFTTLDLLLPLAQRKWLLVLTPVLTGAIALAATFLVDPVFTARTTLLPPRQQSSTAAALLGSLGPLASLAGGAMTRTQGDHYAAMLGSQTVAEKLVDQFELMKVYDEEYRFRARRRLADNSKIEIDKKDGLISIEVTDTNPQRAADIANAYVERLRELAGTIAITEAQQRRQFFERELADARKTLATAQSELQASGISEGMLRAEPRAAVESLAAARSELAATEVQLRVARRTLSDGTAEVQQLLARAAGLREQMSQLEHQQPKDSSSYIDKYRRFKYAEGMVEVFSKQYELARLDELRDGSLIQVVDRATVPEWKSAPKRINIGVITAVLCTAIVIGWVVGRHLGRRSMRDPELAAKARAVGSAWRNGRD